VVRVRATIVASPPKTRIAPSKLQRISRVVLWFCEINWISFVFAITGIEAIRYLGAQNLTAGSTTIFTKPLLF